MSTKKAKKAKWRIYIGRDGSTVVSRKPLYLRQDESFGNWYLSADGKYCLYDDTDGSLMKHLGLKLGMNEVAVLQVSVVSRGPAVRKQPRRKK